MSLENLSLKELQQLEGHAPGLGRFASRNLVSTYDEFVNVLYEDIDQIISLIEENREINSKKCEDSLTIDIKNQLICMGYLASHDKKIGGHVDLAVERNNFKWLGEAKIHSAYDYLFEGLLQLTTRYSNGSVNNDQGGLLIYIKKGDANSVMVEWKARLSEKDLESLDIEWCEKNPLIFFSSHKHDSSGLPYTIRHAPVILHFEPKDKSARNRVKKPC